MLLFYHKNTPNAMIRGIWLGEGALDGDTGNKFGELDFVEFFAVFVNAHDARADFVDDAPFKRLLAIFAEADFELNIPELET